MAGYVVTGTGVESALEAASLLGGGAVGNSGSDQVGEGGSVVGVQARSAVRGVRREVVTVTSVNQGGR